MNIAKMMKQAQQMQKKLASLQSELADKTIEETAGGGKVTVVVSGSGDVQSIKIAPEVVDPEDVEMLEDLILSGVKNAQEKAKAFMEEETSKITGGLGMPPGLGF